MLYMSWSIHNKTLKVPKMHHYNGTHKIAKIAIFPSSVNKPTANCYKYSPSFCTKQLDLGPCMVLDQPLLHSTFPETKSTSLCVVSHFLVIALLRHLTDAVERGGAWLWRLNTKWVLLDCLLCMESVEERPRVYRLLLATCIYLIHAFYSTWACSSRTRSQIVPNCSAKTRVNNFHYHIEWLWGCQKHVYKEYIACR